MTTCRTIVWSYFLGSMLVLLALACVLIYDELGRITAPVIERRTPIDPAKQFDTEAAMSQSEVSIHCPEYGRPSYDADDS